MCYLYKNLTKKMIKNGKNRYKKAEIKVGGICASLLSKQIIEKTGITPHMGIWKEVDDLKLDYNLFPDINYSISYTTRGCVRKCGFCMVPKLEPDYEELKDWERMINPEKELISFWDNNFLACSGVNLPSFTKRFSSA